MARVASFFDDSNKESFFDSDETKQIKREKVQKEYSLMKENAEEDHEAGYENSEKKHSLEERNAHVHTYEH